MRFDTALRATHGHSSFGKVHLLPITQQEGFSLTWRQFLNFRLNLVKNLFSVGLILRAFTQTRFSEGAEVFKKIKIFTFGIGAKVAHVGKKCIAGFLSAKPIEGGVGQDALKQHGQLVCRLIAVVRGQLDHAVLQNVERRFLISYVIERALEGTLLRVFKEI